MKTKDELRGEIERLESQVRDLKAELSESQDLVAEMREHVEDAGDLINSWIEAFGMVETEAGVWGFDSKFLHDQLDELLETHNKLVVKWNKFVPEYNSTVAPRGRGRPLEASDAQVKQVLRLRKKGASLRETAKQTGLGFRTVRSICDREKAGKESQTNLLRKREFDRLRAAEYRARKKVRDTIPKRVNRLLGEGADLKKRAKGLAES
jgi:chromosome segregation ATPase